MFQKAVKRPPYRLAVKKTSLPCRELGVNLVPYLVPQSATTSFDCQSRETNDESTSTIQQVSVECCNVCGEMPPSSSGDFESPLAFVQRIMSSRGGEQAHFGARMLATGKIKPILIVLLSTVLATPVFVGIGLSNFNDDSTDLSIDYRYEKFSHDMLQLQKRYIHQSTWLWHGLRITAWHALTEPLYTMPKALLMVIPYGYEHVGYCIATEAVDSYNKVHDQETIEEVSCDKSSPNCSENRTDVHNKCISLAIEAALVARQKAVLVDHLEKMANKSLPILDQFLDLEENKAENQLLIFTIYLPSAHCNPDFVRMFLIEAWISQVFSRPTIARKLVENTVFITTNDVNVSCK